MEIQPQLNLIQYLNQCICILHLTLTTQRFFFSFIGAGPSTYTTQLIKRQLTDMMKAPPEGISVGPKDDNLFLWEVLMVGPPGTLYEGGFFKATLKFPDDFPNSPPEMRFSSEMWHPNVYPDGKVCISILHPPGTDRYNLQESADERWRPILGVEQVLISVLSLLNEPNGDSPANIDASKMMREDKKEFRRRVRKTVEKSLE